MKKLAKVEVGWKFTVDEGNNQFTVNFPRLTLDGDDLKRRTKWTDTDWLYYAVDLYKKQRGIDCIPKDSYVNRIYANIKRRSSRSG